MRFLELLRHTKLSGYVNCCTYYAVIVYHTVQTYYNLLKQFGRRKFTLRIAFNNTKCLPTYLMAIPPTRAAY